MDGIADMGGTPEWGPVPSPKPDEPVFADPWQGRAFALALLSSSVAGANVDAFRHSLERLDRAAYLDDGYFGRWLNGGELLLTESAILARARSTPAPEIFAARACRSRRFLSPPGRTAGPPRRDHCAPWTPRPPSRSASGCTPGASRFPGTPGFLPTSGVTPVWWSSSNPPMCSRTPMPTSRGENPEHVYSVRFDSRELWGVDAERFSVTVEMYESHLETTS